MNDAHSDTDRWVRSYDSGVNFLEHLDGIPFDNAPLPPRRHRCFAQTRGIMRMEGVQRCPCGAIRLAWNGRWTEKNSTCIYRKKQARASRKRWWRR